MRTEDRCARYQSLVNDRRNLVLLGVGIIVVVGAAVAVVRSSSSDSGGDLEGEWAVEAVVIDGQETPVVAGTTPTATINTVRDQVTPGTSALFLLCSDTVVDKVKAALEGEEMNLLTTNLSVDYEAELSELFAD